MSQSIHARWDERYGAEDYVFGTEPNAFLVAQAGVIPEGPVLCLAEGEGRNAVWLAEQGRRVTGVDASAVGLAKARALAAARGVEIATEVVDLDDYAIGSEAWAGIVSIFAHLPRSMRAGLHRRVVAGLRPGGVFILEAYGPDQIGRGTGGPSDPEMLPTLVDLRAELAGLIVEHAWEGEREVIEGRFHTGMATVTQFVGRKPG